MFKTLIALLLFLIPLYLIRPVYADNISVDSKVTLESKRIDKRVLILKNYLAKYNSPMEDYAQDLVEAADFYNLDWRLVCAIAGTESTFGRFMPGGTDFKYSSYNAWGWGVYGTQAIYFRSFRDGIFTVSKGLRENYLNKGYTDPYTINRIYAASQAWGGHVSYFLEDITKFQDEFEKNINQTVTPSLSFQTAGGSAILASQ